MTRRKVTWRLAVKCWLLDIRFFRFAFLIHRVLHWIFSSLGHRQPSTVQRGMAVLTPPTWIVPPCRDRSVGYGYIRLTRQLESDISDNGDDRGNAAYRQTPIPSPR